MVLAWGVWGWYNRGMNRTIIINTLLSDPKGICSVTITENNRVVHTVDWVNYGLPICNIMEEWDAWTIKYTPRAKRKFLGKSLDPSLLT